METKKCGKIVVITGPSGAGRTTVVEMLKNSDPNFVEPPSVTTRTQRPGEVAGEHYFFVSLDEFEQGVNNDDFIFWNQSIGNYYGLYKSTITKLLSEGKNVILDFPLDEDIYKVKKVYPNIINIYIIPPDVDSLVRRLFARGDNVDTVKCRFFSGFQKYMIEKYGHPSKICGTEAYTIWPDILLDTKYGMFKKMVKDGIIPEIGLGNSFTMGTLPHLFYNKNSSVVRNRMNEYLCTILKKSDSDLEKYWAVNVFDRMIAGERIEDSFVSRCEQIRVAYRNPAAHSGVVQRRTALACSSEIVGREAYSSTVMSRADAFAHTDVIEREQADDCYQQVIGKVDALKYTSDVTGLIIELYDMLK